MIYGINIVHILCAAGFAVLVSAFLSFISENRKSNPSPGKLLLIATIFFTTALFVHLTLNKSQREQEIENYASKMRSICNSDEILQYKMDVEAGREVFDASIETILSNCAYFEAYLQAFQEDKEDAYIRCKRIYEESRKLFEGVKK